MGTPPLKGDPLRELWGVMGGRMGTPSSPMIRD